MGSVLDAVSQQPIHLALVTLGGSSAPKDGNVVLTDSRGRFVFTDLQSGAYSIRVTKAGYSDGAYGSRRPNGTEQVLTLGSDEHLRDARIALWKRGAISGSVYDEFGQPLVDLSVRLLRKMIVAGAPRFTALAAAKTDDRGSYRFAALDAGSYVIQVNPAQAATPAGSGKAKVYPAVFSSDMSTGAGVGVIELTAGDQVRASDLRLTPVEAHRIAGTIVGPEGPVSMSLSLWPESSSGAGDTNLAQASATSDTGGRFLFLGVPEGQYLIRAVKAPVTLRGGSASAGARVPTLVAIQRVQVPGADADDLAITLRDGFRVTGMLKFANEQAALPKDAIRQMRFVLEHVDGRHLVPRNVMEGPFSEEGAFVSSQLPPERYFLRVAGVPPGWTLKDAMVNGRDVSDVPLLLDRDIAGAVITLTTRPTEVSGTVVDESGRADPDATVLIFPADKALWVNYGLAPRRVAAVRVTPTGAYRAVGLPPGDYKLLAVKDEQMSDWPDPNFLERLVPISSALVVAEGKVRSMSLRTVTVARR